MERRAFFQTLLGAGAAVAALGIHAPEETPALGDVLWDKYGIPNSLGNRIRVTAKLIRAGVLEPGRHVDWVSDHETGAWVPLDWIC